MRTALVLSLCLSMAGFARAQTPPPANGGQAEEVELPNPSKKWAYAFGGAALGLWIAGAAVGGAALSFSSAQEGNPSSPMPYTQSLADDANTGKSLATAAYVFFAFAGVATIVDAVLWYECFRKPRHIQKETTPPKSASRIQFTGTGVRF